MSNYYRFINSSERKWFWSMLLSQITIIIISWYFLRKTPSNSECYAILAKDYSFASLLIVMPDECTLTIGFWLRVNHYTMYAVLLLFALVCCNYTISSWYSFIYMFIWTGLLLNAGQMHKDHSIISGNAPCLIFVLLMLVHLEQKPFFDWKLVKQSLNDKNETDQCFIEAMNQLTQCNDDFEREEIFRQLDEKVTKTQLKYQSLELLQPVQSQQEKENILFNGFLFGTLFLLFSLALWNYLLLIYQIILR